MNISNTIKSPAFICLTLVLALGSIWLCQRDDSDKNSRKYGYDFQEIGGQSIANNLKNGFKASISDSQLKITSTNNEDDYNLILNVESILLNSELTSMSANSEVVNNEDGISIKLSDNIIVNYSNTSKGLRQDFIVEDGPKGEVDIKIAIDLETNLVPYRIDPFSIGVKDPLNKAIDISYMDLLVYDADGRMLACNMDYKKKSDDSYQIVLNTQGENISYPLTIDPLITSNSSAESAIDSAYTGYAVDASGDFNNDGICDAIVSSYGFSPDTIRNKGKLDIYLGTVNGIDLSGVPNFTIEGRTQGNVPNGPRLGIGGKFGFSASNAGDINGDGFDDIVVGAPSTSWVDTIAVEDRIQAGAFYIYYGNASGISLTSLDGVFGTSDTMLLGYKVLGMGDADADGFDDILVSAPGALDNKGEVHLYKGSASGLIGIPSNIFEGTQVEEQFGLALGAGDINLDGKDDILIGSPNFIYDNGFRVDTSAGKAVMYLGDNSISSSPDWTAFGEHKNARFGTSIDNAGDYNGDVIGYNDIIVGSDQYNAQWAVAQADTIDGYGSGKGTGAVYVYPGIATGASPAYTTKISVEENGPIGFGASVIGAGDLDSDGRDDIIVGAPFFTKNADNEGALFAYYGSNYVLGRDTTFDWCALGEKSNAFLGFSINKSGGCGMASDTVGVISGAYGFGDDPDAYSGAAFIHKESECGLKKYPKPLFLSFPPDTLFIVSDPNICGKVVSFPYPDIGFNCAGTLTITTPIDTGQVFPIGINTVNFRIESQGFVVDSSFVVKVSDFTPPVPSNCPSLVQINMPQTQETINATWTDPVFTDNHDCNGGMLDVQKISGIDKNTTQRVGVYPVVYQATDLNDNISYCTFRVIINKVSPDGKDCEVKVIESMLNIPNQTKASANVEVEDNLTSRYSPSSGDFGVKLVLSLFEGASGISLPKWVKAAVGEAGTGVNLAFLKVDFSFTPSLDLKYGAYYRMREANALQAAVNYAGSICAMKPADKLYGCRDTIGFSSYFDIDPNAAFLRVNPGDINQTLGVFMKDFVFKWEIFIKTSACIGVPLCVPFFGCGGCAGYTASFETPRVNVFEPIKLLDDPGIQLDLISVCDASFEPGAGIATVFNCLGAGSGADDFMKALQSILGIDNTFIDPFYYNQGTDQFIFDPNRVPVIGNKIPEMNLKFGRLTRPEMGPTQIRGNQLLTSGREPNIFSATLDVFSLLPFIISEAKKQTLLSKGVDLGTRSIDLYKRSSIEFKAGKYAVKRFRFPLISLDLLDINTTIRSDFRADYVFEPTIILDQMDLGESTYWERPSKGLQGTSQFIPNVELDENIKFVVPDGQTEPYFVGNTFRAFGTFTGIESKTQQFDMDFNIVEFQRSLVIPTGFGPVASLGPFNIATFGTTRVRDYNQNIVIPNFAAVVSLTPDDIPPVVACRDTTVVMNAQGLAFLDLETAFISDPTQSFDLPLNGSGSINLIDVFPDTIFCNDYPETFGFLVTEDDNCNFDTCQFTVFLQDLTLPSIGCQDIVVGVGENGTYNLQPEEVIIGAIDNCMTITSEVTPNMFDCADVGQAIDVTATVTDVAGNMISCMATVTIVDTMVLFLECPFLPAYPAVRGTDLGFCSYTPMDEEFRPRLVAPDCNTVITYELTGATTGSGASNVDGVPFNLGLTTITYTATDASGNTIECSFDVVVEDVEAPFVRCPDDLILSTNADMANDYNCSTSYSWTHPTAVDNCSSIDFYEIHFLNPDGTEEVIDLDARLQNDDLDETRVFNIGTTVITYTARDTMDNEFVCSYDLLVIDDELPEIFCNEIVATNTYSIEDVGIIKPNDDTEFIINVPTAVNITDLNILAMIGTLEDMEDLSASLTSPQGITIDLFTTFCPATSDFDLSLDDTSSVSVTLASCGPLGGGLQYAPLNALANFNTSNSAGEWILTLSNDGLTCGMLEAFEIEIIGLDTAGMVNDLSFVIQSNGCQYEVEDTALDPRFIDNCTGASIMHDYPNSPSSTTLNGTVLPLGLTVINWTVTDSSGNVATCTLELDILDNSTPVFTNCPSPIVAQNAETDECSAYVNFSLPLAVDGCDADVKVNQIDGTGLTSGSVFPVGQTILIFEAMDDDGNTATCSMQIVVNDTQDTGFECAGSVDVPTAIGACNATVTNIAPSNLEDFCLLNNTVVYQIEYPAGSGIIVASGVEDASGTTFDKGESVVTYRLQDQPVLLITEVTNEVSHPNGGQNLPYTTLTGDDYIEITNLGPAAYDVSRLLIERHSADGTDPFVVPDGTVIEAGASLVLHYGNGDDDLGQNFFNLVCSSDLTSADPASYSISFEGKVIDAVAINNAPGSGLISNLDWSGNIGLSGYSAGIRRDFSYDNNTSDDWSIVSTCQPLNIGSLNEGVEAYASNGQTMGLQLVNPDIEICDLTVTVLDIEGPSCVEFEDILNLNATRLNEVNGLAQGACFESEINVTGGTTVGDLSILNIQGEHSSFDSVLMTLISPSGTSVNLIHGVCAGQQLFNFNLDSDSIPNVSNAICGDIDSDIYFAPIESLDAFIGEPTQGIWTLRILNYGSGTGFLASWELLINDQLDYSMTDVSLDNIVGQCSAELTWTQPRFGDNCVNGSIRVEYTTNDDINTPTNGPVDGGTDATELFEVGTTTVTYYLVDAEGNVNTCSFDVTVLDAEDPTLPIDLCRNITIGLDAGECSQQINFPTSIADVGMDNCSIVDVNYNPPSGTFFEIGVTPVTLTVTDPAGNTAQCIFNVELIEYDVNSNDISCNDEINISLNSDCIAEITADMILEGSDYYCYENYCITITDQSGNVVDLIFNESDVNQSFIVTITDCVDSQNSCWGTINVEEKLIPEFDCPKDTIVTCNQDLNPFFLGRPTILSCESNIKVTYADDITNNGFCDSPRASIIRHWTIDDQEGNVQYCSQLITIEAADLDDIVWPVDVEIDEAIECSDLNQDPSLISAEVLGYPEIYGNNLLDNPYCSITTNVSDETYSLCEGSYEILRIWKVRNMCLPVSVTNPRVHTQIIRVFDTEGPKIAPCPDDITVSTDPWLCWANTPLPLPEKMEDLCSSARFDALVYGGGSISILNPNDLDNLVVNASNLAIGEHHVYYYFTDDCQNTSKCDFYVTVGDYTAPVAIAEKDIVVSLTPLGGTDAGSAKLYTDAFDNYSYDNCTDVYLEIRRDEGSPSCGNLGINDHNNNITYNNDDHIDDSPMDSDGGQFVKFCCEDILNINVDANGDGIIDTLDRGYVQVFLRVWDDANGSNVYGDVVDGQRDNFNETWTFVKVEDKLPPVLTCPDDATIFCDWGIDLSTDFPSDAVQGWVPVMKANFDKTDIASAYSTCGIEGVEFKDTDQTDKCGVGTIVRQFRTSNNSKTGPKTVVCQQIITVLARPSEFAVIPPVKNPIVISECTLTSEIIEAARNNPSLANRFPRVTGGACDVIGESIQVDTFLFEDGVCKKWRVQFSYYNWCDHSEEGPFDVIFYYDDTEKPEIVMCQDTMFGVDSECEHILTLSNIATDGGGCIEGGWLKWQVFVDTWGDGKIDHYASFYRSESRWNRIARYLANGMTNPAWEALPDGQDYADYVWVKNVGAISNGDKIELEIEKEVIVGKMSNHKVHWKVTDGCHNFTTCSQEIMVADKKAPTPYCVNISTALMDAGSVEIWARDFDNGSFDNCTPQEDLLFTFAGMHPVLDKLDEEHFFTGAGVESTQSAYNNGDAQKWNPEYKSSSKIFDCDEFKSQSIDGALVFMSVWDKKFNTDFCVVNLKLVDNHNACEGDGSRVAGTIQTDAGEALDMTTVTIESDVNDLNKTVVVDGVYAFNSLPNGLDYRLSASKDEDYMNGVSTLDLILIQRHILGIQSLNTPYKLIAADVNDDRRIRTADLVDLRKLILGVIAELPKNESWKIVEADQPMTMDIPLAYGTTIEINNLQDDRSGEDFIAIKVGDVNGSAKANIRSNSSEPRSNTTIHLLADEQLVEAGQTVSVDITSDNFNEVFGYQFTTALNGLTLTGVRSGAIEMSDDNVGLPQAGVVTASWASDALTTVAAGEVLFTLDFVATANGMVSRMMHINSNITTAESYIGSEMNVSDIALTFRTETGDATAVYALGQNEPNPFKAVTTIPYEMAKAGAATFTLYDVTGKVLVVRTEQAEKGLNTVEFKANEISASGIVYYQIESGDFTATKKMLILD